MSDVIFLIKKRNYKEILAPHTQEQVWRALLLLLYNCRICISVPSPNQYFHKYDFLKNQ